MKLLKAIILSCVYFYSCSIHADYGITSEDFLLEPSNVKIRFKHGLFNSYAEVSFRTCAECPWRSYPTTDETMFYNQRFRKTFEEFKFIINSKQVNNKYVLISLSHHSNSVRVLKWKYEAG